LKKSVPFLNKKGGKKVKVRKFLIPEEKEESQSFLQVTLFFTIRSDMESLLKKAPIVSKLSEILTEEEIPPVGPISSNIKKVNSLDLKTLNKKRNLMSSWKERKNFSVIEEEYL
jgi:hypothetical protein